MFIAVMLILVFSCKKENDALTNKFIVNGFVQKGPFIQGSEVRIQELTPELMANGKSYFTETNDDFGSFTSNSEIPEGYIDIATTGFYFNEIEGKLSNSFITLKGISYLNEEKKLNINILTTLAFDRIKYLITNDKLSFVEASKKAQKEVLKVFLVDLPDGSMVSFEEMDISASGVSNSILLAISSILQFNNSEAELSELVTKISDEIRADGVLNNESLKSVIRENSMNLDVEVIIENLQKRYSDLGLQISIPDFGNYIDKDGDGSIDLYQTPPPLISPKPEMVSSDPVLVTITCDLAAEIYFTTDGSNPDETSNKYVEPFQIGLDGKTVTVKAIAYSEGLDPSPITSYTYRFLFQQAFSPKYKILAGTYNHDLNLELYSEDDDVELFYTTDGSIPNSNSIKYSDPIAISGNNTVFEIKAIAIHPYLEPSMVSGSYYKIDYDFDENEFIDNLTVAEYNEKLVGVWIGNVSNPWTGPYNIELEVFNNGNYSAHSLSAYKYPYGVEVLFAAFYYGTDNDSDLKKVEINDLYATGKASGEIIIFFDPDTTIGSLNQVAISNNGDNLQFEFWHRNQFGPLVYKLTRKE